MKRKSIKFKRLRQLMAVILCSTSLLGISYAYWTEGIIATGIVQTTKIDSNYDIITPYQFCAHQHSTAHTCDNINPSIAVKNNGEIPIVIDSVEIVELQYYSANYQDSQYVSSWNYVEYWIIWPLFKGSRWEEVYTNYIKKSNLSPIKTAWINQKINNLNHTVDINESQTLILPINYKAIVSLINLDMQSSNIYQNAKGYKDRINNIDADRQGVLKVKVNYRQWNTTKGWRKTITIDIPVNWSRYDVNQIYRIYPNLIDYAATNIPDVARP